MQIKNLILISGLVFILSACGGGSNGSDSKNTNANNTDTSPNIANYPSSCEGQSLFTSEDDLNSYPTGLFKQEFNNKDFACYKVIDAVGGRMAYMTINSQPDTKIELFIADSILSDGALRSLILEDGLIETGGVLKSISKSEFEQGIKIKPEVKTTTYLQAKFHSYEHVIKNTNQVISYSKKLYQEGQSPRYLKYSVELQKTKNITSKYQLLENKTIKQSISGAINKTFIFYKIN